MNFTLRHIFLIGILLSLGALTSCDEQSVQKSSKITDVEIDSTKSSLVNVSGKLFSIPSPIQTALLIQKSGAPYQSEALNNPKNSNVYSSKLKRSLNLGVFGTDMAYASLSEDDQSALRHFKAVENISEALGVKAAIDSDLVKRLGANAGNPDSLLILSGEFYREADNYLKENERTDVATLVLTGGWVEATYLTGLATKNDNDAAKTRLAEQVESINTICDVLKTVNDQELKESDFLLMLDSLNASFQQIEKTYTYQAPVTEAEAKKTILKSTSTYTLSDSLMSVINGQVTRLRNKIIQP